MPDEYKADQASIPNQQNTIWPPPPTVEMPTLPLPKRRQRPPLTWRAVLNFVLGGSAGYLTGFLLTMITMAIAASLRETFDFSNHIFNLLSCVLGIVSTGTTTFVIGRRYYFFGVGMALGAVIWTIEAFLIEWVVPV